MIPIATNQGRLITFSSFLKTEAGFLSDFTIYKTDGNHGNYWGFDLRQQNYYRVIVAAVDERQPVCVGQLTTHSAASNGPYLQVTDECNSMHE